MHLSSRAIVVIFTTGFVMAWVVGETIGGWRGALTEIGMMIAVGAALCFACRDDQSREDNGAEGSKGQSADLPR